ncbi:MAG: glutaredoxin [Alphaproteobacteria bacterium]|jgi:glutaredoxin 3|nr:glutaredoxin [Candidatus Jidaibacter sp.]
MSAILIYTKHHCKQSDKIRHLLNIKKVPFEEKDISHDVLIKREMMERTGGRVITPQVFINGRHIGGLEELIQHDFSDKKVA